MCTRVCWFLPCSFHLRENKGVTWSDVAGVTQNAFNRSMEGMQRGLGTVSSTLRSLKDDLAEKIWRVEEKMLSTNREIRSKIESAVGDARKSIDDVGLQVDKLQKVVNGLDNQFGSIDDSMQFAVRGVYMLCTYVSQLGNLSSKAQSELGLFLSAAEGAEERTRLEHVTHTTLLGPIPTTRDESGLSQDQ